MGRSFVIWWIGTTRRLDVENAPDAYLPAVAQPYLENTSDKWSHIYGDFRVCPTEPDVPGHMRSVCVAESHNLVVQSVNGSRPPEEGATGLTCDSTAEAVRNARVRLDVGTAELHDGEGRFEMGIHRLD